MNPDTEKWPGWAFFIIIAACIALVYGQSLTFSFVNYDDYDLVYENGSYLANKTNIISCFATHAFTGKRKDSVYYRPILIASYIIDYQFWKLDPAGYHFTNLLLHLVSSFLFFLLAAALIKKKITALLASLLFALHPVQVESVAWIAGRNDVLLGLFIIMMMYFYVRHYDEEVNGRRFLLFSYASFAFALFTKESAAFYLLLFPLYDLVSRRKSFRDFFKIRGAATYVLPLVILAAYMLVRLSVFGVFIGAEKLYGILPMQDRLQLIPGLLSEHLQLLFFPAALSIEHQLDTLLWFRSPWYILAIIISVILLLIIWRIWRADRVVTFGYYWLLVGLIPTLNIIPAAVPILEHRLYAPLAGFSLLVISAVFSLGTLKKRNLDTKLAIAIIGVLSVLSLLRTPVWKNSETLWLDAIRKEPAANRPYFNLGGYYYEQRKYEKTIPLLEKYIELKPDDFLGYSKLRQTYFMMGKYPEAAMICRQMIQKDPKSQNRYLDLGLMFEHLRLADSAIAVYRKALEIDPGFFEIHERLGSIFSDSGMTDSAEIHYRLSIGSKDDYAPAYFGLGMILYRKGNYDDALANLEKGTEYGEIPDKVLPVLNALRERFNKQANPGVR